MDDTPGPVDARTLRFLRLLVTVLTATMILGLLVIIALFVIKFSEARPRLALPDEIALPEGARATSFTRGDGWYAVVTDDDRILIYGAKTGKLMQEIEITTGE